MKKNRGMLKKVIICFVSIIVFAMIVSSWFVQPTIYGFRFLVDTIGDTVNIGPYEDELEQVEEVEKIDIPVEGYPNVEWTVYAPKTQEKALPLILFTHGGGWSIGKPEMVARYAKLLAAQGYVVVNTAYSLAPEHPYPASTEQLAIGLDYLSENFERLKIDDNALFFAGNSAGSHLSAQLATIITNPTYAQNIGISSSIKAIQLKGVVLINGVYDFSVVGESGFPMIHNYLWAYTGKKNYLKYERLNEMSVQNFITDKFPPSFITAGDSDPLESQSVQFAGKLIEKGVTVDTLFWETGNDLNHDYVYDLSTQEGQIAYTRIVAFLENETQ